MRLVRAEILKLAKRRGTMIWTAVLTLGAVLVTDAILIVLHAANPDKHGPAGGRVNLDNVVSVLGALGPVAAIIVGSAAGSQDVSAGVFRDLVVTGTPRKKLFAVRLPGALAVFMPLVIAAFGVAVLCAYVFAGGNRTPGGGDLARYALYLAAILTLNMAMAIGLTAVLSSRVVVGVLLAWNAVVAPLLIQIHALGGARKLVDVAAAAHFLPSVGDNGIVVPMSGATALAVLAGWLAVFLLLGRIWTERRDA